MKRIGLALLIYCSGLMAAVPTYKAASAGVYNVQGNARVFLPAGWAAGDFAILFATTEDQYGVNVLTPGWTYMDTLHVSTSMVSIIYYRYLAAGDTSPWAYHNPVSIAGAVIWTYSGVSSTQPIDVIGSTHINTNTNIDSADAMVPTAGNVVVFIGSFQQGNATFSGFTGSPTPTSEYQYNLGALNFGSFFIADWTQVSGSTGIRSVPWSPGFSRACKGKLFSLNPAGTTRRCSISMLLMK